MKIGNIEIDGKLILAPMAGYTNKVYRKLCHDYGANLTVSEMISDKGLLYENDKTWEMCAIDEKEHPVSLQLFGGDIDEMVRAAKEIEKRTSCDILDINMGCPVKKVIKAGSGAFLLKDIPYAKKMVESIVHAVSLPVTVKMRTGWDHQSIHSIEMAKAMEEAGASAITLHGRTKSDLYSGSIDYELIHQVKQSVSIPVIGNGDVKTNEDLEKMLSTQVDAVMIGRASLGNPWIFKQFQHYLHHIPYIPPTNQEKIQVMKEHFLDLKTLKGEKIALLEMRTLASWYVKGMKNAKEFKMQLIHISSSKEFLELINHFLTAEF